MDMDFTRLAAAEALIDLCATRGTAVQTIKAVAKRRWPADSTEPHYSWYEPLPAGDALRRAVEAQPSLTNLPLHALLEPLDLVEVAVPLRSTLDIDTWHDRDRAEGANDA